VTVDVLAIGAHPDDVEIGIGGLVHKLVRRGLTVGILDLTQGELASRGTPRERHEEAGDAARVLGVAIRENAGLPDGHIANSAEHQQTLIPLLRALRPHTVVAPMPDDRHPDHDAAHTLVRDANYFSGLIQINSGNEPHRAERMYFYRVYGDPTPPTFVVDISEDFDTKIQALEAYTSQFHNPDFEGELTYVSSEAFWESIRTRAQYWGSRIGTAYGESLHALAPVAVDLPPGLEGRR
jgi:bacillithiol biosynthesis deacetylase BshB1